MGIFKVKKLQDKVWGIVECKKSELEGPQYLLQSQYSSQNEIQDILDRIDFGYHKNFIIFGLRNIELLAEIYKRKTPFSTMTIIEISDNEDEEFFYECEESKLSFLFDDRTVDIAIGIGADLSNQLEAELGKMIKLYNLRNIEIISMPYIKSAFPKEIEDTVAIIFEKLYAAVNAFGNSAEDILWGTDNYINNWKHVFRGIDYSGFENMYKGKPAIIVGAGPSLEKNIEKLKLVNGKALIMCVDAALDTLINAGIIPDIVASIERTEITTKFYKREVMPKSIVYVGPNVVPGAIFERFDRIIFTGRRGDGLFQDFNNYLGFHNLEIGSNVAAILVAFAQYLGCSPIIFVGLDLAYTNGRTHTSLVMDNIKEEDMKNSYRNKELVTYVKGQDGEMLETFEFFRHAKVWIENQIAKNKDRKYINATEGGANIVGAENHKLENVISEYCSGEKLVPIQNKYDELISEFKINKIEITEKAVEYFNQLMKFYNDISKVSKSYYNKFNKGIKNDSMVQMLETCRAKMAKELDKSLAGAFIVQSITISYHRDIHSFPMVLDKENERKMVERSKDFYDTLSKVSKKINETLKIYKKILNSHLITYKNEESTANGDA